MFSVAAFSLILGTAMGCALRVVPFLLVTACAVLAVALTTTVLDALVSLVALQCGYALGLLARALAIRFLHDGEGCGRPPARSGAASLTPGVLEGSG